MTKAKFRDFQVTTAEAEKVLGLPKGHLLNGSALMIPYAAVPGGDRWVWASDVIIALKSTTPRVMNAKPAAESKSGAGFTCLEVTS